MEVIINLVVYLIMSFRNKIKTDLIYFTNDLPTFYTVKKYSETFLNMWSSYGACNSQKRFWVFWKPLSAIFRNVSGNFGNLFLQYSETLLTIFEIFLNISDIFRNIFEYFRIFFENVSNIFRYILE